MAHPAGNMPDNHPKSAEIWRDMYKIQEERLKIKAKQEKK